MKERKNEKIRVCIIEDDPLISEMYSVELKKWGFKVAIAEDGVKGLAELKKHNYNIALIDIMMPNKNGIELMQDIRADKELKNLPLVILTNFDDSNIVKKTQKFNAAFYLVKSNFKPFDVVKIVREITGDNQEII